jgi:NADPH:quinone reductase
MRRAKGGQVVVRMLATSVTAGRADVAGVVQTVGPDVTGFACGDRVFGQLVIPPTMFSRSAPREMIVSEDAPLAHIPPGLDPRVAATVPTAAATALAVVDSLEPLHGKTVLIVGDGDGMGSFATQFAANAGAHVIAQTHPSDAARMRAYGAATTVHGSVANVMDAVAAAHPTGIDIVIDLAGEPAGFADLALLLRPWGTALTTKDVADPYALIVAGVIGINHTPTMTAELLRRVGEAIVERRIFPPPLADLQLAAAA